MYIYVQCECVINFLSIVTDTSIDLFQSVNYFTNLSVLVNFGNGNVIVITIN